MEPKPNTNSLFWSLVSFAIFVLVIIAFAPDRHQAKHRTAQACEYSPMGMNCRESENLK